ncbi:hypothetical protein HBH70_200710 [Parastagonospora nodorum]|nr:hypothetical protein HBH70_200710 [Parastagonospora nodorum]
MNKQPGGSRDDAIIGTSIPVRPSPSPPSAKEDEFPQAQVSPALRYRRGLRMNRAAHHQRYDALYTNTHKMRRGPRLM